LIKDIQVLKEHIEYVFELFEKTIDGINEEELDWRPTEEANNIRGIITHLSRICNVSLPSRIKGDPYYKPNNWPNDYEENHHSFEKLLTDIENGRKAVINGLDGLSHSDMEAKIPLWGGMRKRKIGLFSHLSEIAHHKGQIAYIRGIRKRQKEKANNS
jgi:hypothetical protein